MKSATSLWLVCLLLAVCHLESQAGTSTIVLSGAPASGITNAVFDAFDSAAVNSQGQFVFSATLLPGAGGVTTATDEGIWLYDSGITSLVAREGSGSVPDVSDANFTTFRDFAISESGEVIVRAELESGTGGVSSVNSEGTWSFQPGSDSLVVRIGDSLAPGVAGGQFKSIPGLLRVAADGHLAMAATLEASTESDKGVWSYNQSAGTLIAREAISDVPDINGEFFTFAEPRVNDDQDLVFRATLERLGSITVDNMVGIWKYTDSGAGLLAREGVQNVPDIAATSFTQMSDPALNGQGHVAISSRLTHVGSVGSTNDAGIWLFSDATSALVAQTGSGGVPEVPAADFSTFEQPLVSDFGSVLVEAKLAIGVGGVTSDDDLGLWAFDGLSSFLIARTGSGSVPDVNGEDFDDFEHFTMNAAGQVALKASLQNSGAVDPNNDDGIWFFDSDGEGSLVAREGDLLEGRTISGLDFIGGSGGNDGKASGLNGKGQLVFRADFTNGDSGLFLYQHLTADFDNDGDVDNDDLTHPTLGWQARYGVDLDGQDFLNWQREIAATASLSVSVDVVPEPSGLLLGVVILAWVTFWRRAI